MIAEAGWSGKAFASAVNKVGAEAGITLHYTSASVSQWCAGTRPQAPVPELMAEALSRRLGRLITVRDLGYKERPTTSWWDLHAAAQLSLLAPLPPNREAALALRVYNLTALEIPASEDIRTLPPPGPAALQLSVTQQDTVTANSALVTFAMIDNAYGASAIRPAAAAYFARIILPWLQAATRGRPRRDLLSLACRIAYLCGFLNFDDELHGPAQRYYRAALVLAAENNHAEDYALALRAMSAQAHLLGHYPPALHLAEAAVATRRLPQVTRAFVLGQAAVAHAAAGNRREAVELLGRAERLLNRSPTVPRAIGTYHSAALAHHQAVVHSHLGDRRAAIAALQRSVRNCPGGERRTRALALASIAELQLREGHLEEASATWNRFLDLYPMLHSGRARTALHNLHSRLRPYARDPVVGPLLHRAAVARTLQ
ncbi:hypothetical protein [Actinomadura terrae]|uniref:hypothetical protein n=1 Tax=Actinomadura terrae TaxID=604353 RepID=UPI001FA7C3B1|nr:hypothetical protein [Actinomadura terrae]